jgi:hypothetical protein
VKRAILALVLAGTPMVVLGQHAPTDFARGAGIRAEGGSLLRVQLPDDVYETVVRADLGDLRVLNAAGDAVPHTLRQPARPPTADAEWRDMPSFAMSAAQTRGPARTQVRVDANGAVLEVTGDPERTAVSAYLVDVSTLEEPLTRLALSWTAPEGVTFLSRVSVQGSDDLDTWRTLVPSAALAQLRRDALVLTQNEIELSGSSRAKYLRISWPTELADVTLTGVRARPRSTATEREIRWRTLSAVGTEEPGTAYYDARGLFPVEYIDLEFQDGSQAADTTVQSRPTPESDWQTRRRGLFYALMDGGVAVRNERVSLPPTAERYWRLQRHGAGWAPTRPPRLRIGWHPHELVFVAQGAAPFTLVYGSARVDATDARVDALLTTLDEAARNNQIRTATLEPPRSLGGAEVLTPPRQVRGFVLWGVLVAAVLVLAVLALRLFRETGRTDGPAV